MTSISNILNIEPGITAIIGSGGKSTLLKMIGNELGLTSSVILATTTKMYPPENIPIYDKLPLEQLKNFLTEHRVVTVGTVADNGKLSAPPYSFRTLSEFAPYVIAECDGSKRLPIKAHRPFEPVIPSNSTRVIAVVGMSGMGKTVDKAVHCPDLFATLVKCSLTDTVNPLNVSKALIEEYRYHGHMKFDCLVLNQIQTDLDLENAKCIAKIIARELPVSVFCGNIREGELICLS